MSNLKVGIGGSARDDGHAFVEAWRRAETGDRTLDRAVSFQSWEALAAVLTPERLRLLRHLVRRPEPSIVALAKALGRQYRRVHDDVTILERSGLVRRDGRMLQATTGRIETVIELA